MDEKKEILRNKPEKMTDSLAEFEEEIEGRIVTLPFNMSGFPKSFHKEVDTFCKKKFGDNRFAMFKHLWDYYQDDTRIKVLDDKIDLAINQFNLGMAFVFDKIQELEKYQIPEMEANEKPAEKKNLLAVSDKGDE